MQDIHRALFLANLLYNIELLEDDFEEIALICHRMIGNRIIRIYHYVADIDPEDLSVELPCNCDDEYGLEAVMYGWEDWDYTSNIAPNGEIATSFTEQYIESRKHFTDPLYHRGKYAEYHKAGNKLYFKHNHGKIHILYKGEMLDDNGLPYVNDKEIMAIAKYVAYVATYKEGLKTKNGSIMLLAQDLYRQAMTAIDEARTPIKITLNEMDEILEVKTSMNRKVHNRSYKPLM